MTAEPNARTQGILILGVEGIWNVDELSALLRDLHEIYRRLNAFLPISPNFDRFIREAAYFYPSPHVNIDPILEVIMSAAIFETAPLRLMRIELASPGFLAVLGALNPLKTIADFITAWRHENSIRQKMEIDAQLEREKMKSAERMSLSEMLRPRISALSQEDIRGITMLLAAQALNGSERLLTEIAKDSRITTVELRLAGG